MQCLHKHPQNILLSYYQFRYFYLVYFPFNIRCLLQNKIFSKDGILLNLFI